MTDIPELPADSVPDLAGHLAADVEALDRELAEIDMLIGQAQAEATRHEQKRAAAAERLEGAASDASPESYGQLVTFTRRAVLMESQVDLLEGKRRALARHREAIAEIVATLQVADAREDGADSGAGSAEPGAIPEALPPSVSRLLLNAQEDLRREIARAMHDGPAQSLTNIVLQAQIATRVVERDPSQAQGELNLLVSMVQQTLDATKSFIFDVRPMVLDDLGLVPTLRRAARDRGRQAGIPVAFETVGQDRRLPMEIETTAFRIVDQALTAYLRLRPDRMTLTADWSEGLELCLAAERDADIPDDIAEPLPEVPGGDVPDAIKQMIQERHDARAAAMAAAEAAAVVVLPAATARDAAARAQSIRATLEVMDHGGKLRLVVPLPSDAPAREGEA
jgi:two-component system sensor histidine kinase DegS